MWNPTRAFVFWARYYMYLGLFKFHFKFPSNLTFWKPGLEIKYALEEAESQNKPTYFLGPEFN